MIDLMRFALLEVGLVYFISMSAIFAPARMVLARIRFVRALIYCASCTGFWVGAVLYFAGFTPDAFAVVPTQSWIQAAAVSAFAGLAVANIWHMTLYRGGNDAYEDEQLTTEAPSAETTKEESDV